MQRLKKALGTGFKALLSVTALAVLAVCALLIVMYFSPPKDTPWDREYRLDYKFSAAIGVMGSEKNRALVDKIAIVHNRERYWYATLAEFMAQSPYITTEAAEIQTIFQEIDLENEAPDNVCPCDHTIAETTEYYHMLAFDSSTDRTGYLRFGVCLDGKYLRAENRLGSGVYWIKVPPFFNELEFN